MPEPIVSVVLPTYNRASFLERAIKSVLAQTSTDWELVISDDASSDETADVALSWQKKDQRIVYIRNDQNLGIAGNVNRAIRTARGKYIALLDDDDPWTDSKKLEKQIGFLEEHPDYVGVGGGMIVVDQGGREIFRFLKPQTDEEIRRTMFFSNPMANSTTCYRKEAAERVGLYDETLVRAADRDFWMKMGKIGKLYNFPEYFGYYTIAGQNSLFKNQRELYRYILSFLPRYKHDYPRYLAGLIFNYGIYIYALMPEGLRSTINLSLFRLKRKVFDRIS